MPWPVHPNGLLGAQGDSDSYRIERSLRFNSADSAYLNRTPSSAGNRKTWTWSGWVKRSGFADQAIFEAGYSSAPWLFFGFVSNNLYLTTTAGVSGAGVLVTNAVFRDASAWYHIVISVDTTQGTASNRVSLYVNNVLQSIQAANYPSQNSDLQVNNTIAHQLGGYTSTFFDGYLAEINFIDGQALTPSSFGETDSVTGRWKAKAYAGTYGTNGFYLKFADNSDVTSTTLGKDSSGNGNNWTPNNFSVTAGAGNDSLVDSPTNYGTDTGVGGIVRGNYCTLNPLAKSSGTLILSDGNLKIGDGTAYSRCNSTIQVSIGKWYFEAVFTVSGANTTVGIGQNNITNQYPGQDTLSYAFDLTAAKTLNNDIQPSYGVSLTTGDILQCAFDLNNNKLFFGKNGTWMGSSDPVAGTNPAYTITQGVYTPIARPFTTGALVDFNFGQRPFTYTAPTGFKALCTQNLPQPTIQKPSRYMDALAYTGTGASNSISSLGFSPDLVWIKNRGTTTDHAIYDTTRGTGAQLSSNLTDAEVTSSTGLTAFGSSGFTIGTSTLVNTSGTQYIAWAWDETPIAGMDIVSYTGTGAIRTVAHNLGVAPKMIIAKLTNSAGFQWPVYHSSLTSALSYIWLNSTNAQATDAAYWGTAPTSSVFSVGTNSNVNNNTSPYIAYLFAEVEGYSKFGSYIGNASTDGPFIWCGFRPRFIMIKRSDSVEPWIIKDTARSIYNGYDVEIYPNYSNAEGGPYSPPIMDYLSNGFKLRSNPTGSNASGGTYIFVAFAESPFKYARAR